MVQPVPGRGKKSFPGGGSGEWIEVWLFLGRVRTPRKDEGERTANRVWLFRRKGREEKLRVERRGKEGRERVKGRVREREREREGERKKGERVRKVEDPRR